MSVLSDWVKEEAEKGKKRRIIVPILIDEVEMPMRFGRIQAARLVDWQGPPLPAWRSPVDRLTDLQKITHVPDIFSTFIFIFFNRAIRTASSTFHFCFFFILCIHILRPQNNGYERIGVGGF